MDSQINPLFANALSTGKVVVRRWWVNTQSEKDQVSVQFQQEIEKDTDDNSLVAIAQGGNSKQKPTAIFSFKTNVAQAILGSTEGSFVQGGQPIFGSEMWKGREVNIQVTENFTANPRSKSQQPKANPLTGEIVTSFNSDTQSNDPVYRHTEIVAGSPTHTFVETAHTAANMNKGALSSGINLEDILTR